ncbi:MAG: nitroreductase family protein [Firmicutes bacterium]|nr:nitroreductase family protein [Bacillota bacterium]
MDFLKLAKDRYSVRKFKADQITEAELNQVLEAGRVAPSAKNFQPTKVYAVQSEENLAKIRELTVATFGAPTVLVFCSEDEKAWVSPFTGFNSGVMDVSILASHMMLQAAELGLGTTWVCWVDTDEVGKVLGIPENLKVRLIMPLGYPADDCQPAPMHADRKPMDEFVTVL